VAGKEMIRWLVMLCMLTACSTYLISAPLIDPLPVEEGDVLYANWSRWAEQDGAVVFVSDGRVGAMTFIIVDGSVDFDLGLGAQVSVSSVTTDSATLRINEQQHTLLEKETVVVDGISVLLDTVIVR